MPRCWNRVQTNMVVKICLNFDLMPRLRSNLTVLCLRQKIVTLFHIWTASSEFGTYRLCEQRRFRRACASAQSRQNLCCSPIQAVNQEEPSDRKPDPWPLWMAGHAQLKFVMTECSMTLIRLTGLIWHSKMAKVCFCCMHTDLFNKRKKLVMYTLTHL